MKKYLYNLAADKYKGPVFGIIKAFLLLISLVYGLIIRGLIFLYSFRQRRLDVKVISVGNITVGGTGKTSLVEYLARYLRQQGRNVAILSRGYKKPSSFCQTSANMDSCFRRNDTTYKTMGDEPYMLSQKLGDIPVIVDTNRVKAAGRAIKDYGADTVILDDGFQQWGIIKDLEIVAVDTTNPFGNCHMIPRGFLREPLSCLRRADIFVLTKVDFGAGLNELKDILKRINPNALIVESIHKPVGLYMWAQPSAARDDTGTLFLNIDTLKGKQVAAFSGIGDPGSFENLLNSLGAKVSLSFRFPDHHNYTKLDLERIIKGSLSKGIDTIITTEKDAVRLGSLELRAYSLQLLCLRIELTITKNEQGFCDRLLQLYSC